MVLQFTEKLHTQKSIQRHKKQEKQCHIVDLLTRTPNERAIFIRNLFDFSKIIRKTYLKIWLMRLFGIENFKKTRKNRIIISGRGARSTVKYENGETISSDWNICNVTDVHRNVSMLASNWHQWSRRYGTSLCNVFCKEIEICVDFNFQR